ncbi:MAG: UDP-N-acetylmuramoyl-tripeptide--D-alanyl-D-alanine ligase [Bdellovibrionales bacterium]|nr:UDP-N-acetylmuramoyl-tripeptide--D-alanyl-D-alanine ligase [Bdellovibrionales bacterium]
MNLQATFVLQALGASARASGRSEALVFSGVTSDSRKAGPGLLFVAVPGEKFDGHAFIPQALAAGAGGVICRKGTPRAAGSALFIEVDDTIEAYRTLAAAWRARFKIPLLAVAGSVGKTTTKEFLAALMRGKHKKVLKTEGSQNGFLGVAMTLLELRPHHGAAVVEIGIDEPGAMIRHLEVVRPTSCVLTAIGPEHLEKLKDLDTVAREEGLAFDFTARAGGAVAVNLDDPWIAPWAEKLQREPYRARALLGFKLGPEEAGALRSQPNMRTLVGIPLSPERMRLGGTALPGKGETLRCPLPGSHNQRNLLAALALAMLEGLTPREARRGLESFEGAGGRTQVLKGKRGLHLLADHYNANPTSVEAALKLLANLKQSKQASSWACLGDMLELGPGEERFHRELGPALERSGVRGVFLYGPRMAHLLDELRHRRFTGIVEHYESHGALAARIGALARKGDWVLIKGSRGMKMEKVLESLK